MTVADIFGVSANESPSVTPRAAGSPRRPHRERGHAPCFATRGKTAAGTCREILGLARHPPSEDGAGWPAAFFPGTAERRWRIYRPKAETWGGGPDAECRPLARHPGFSRAPLAGRPLKPTALTRRAETPTHPRRLAGGAGRLPARSARPIYQEPAHRSPQARRPAGELGRTSWLGSSGRQRRQARVGPGRHAPRGPRQRVRVYGAWPGW